MFMAFHVFEFQTCLVHHPNTRQRRLSEEGSRYKKVLLKVWELSGTLRKNRKSVIKTWKLTVGPLLCPAIRAVLNTGNKSSHTDVPIVLSARHESTLSSLSFNTFLCFRGSRGPEEGRADFVPNKRRRKEEALAAVHVHLDVPNLQEGTSQGLLH